MPEDFKVIFTWHKLEHINNHLEDILKNKDYCFCDFYPEYGVVIEESNEESTIKDLNEFAKELSNEYRNTIAIWDEDDSFYTVKYKLLYEHKILLFHI